MSDKITDGGPAFPVPDDVYQIRRAEVDEVYLGMTLRDWFAGQALPAIVADDKQQEAEGGPAFLAAAAYDLADAMLEARETSK